jgi:hypothetical protein
MFFFMDKPVFVSFSKSIPPGFNMTQHSTLDMENTLLGESDYKPKLQIFLIGVMEKAEKLKQRKKHKFLEEELDMEELKNILEYEEKRSETKDSWELVKVGSMSDNIVTALYSFLTIFWATFFILHWRKNEFKFAVQWGRYIFTILHSFILLYSFIHLFIYSGIRTS